MSELPTTLEWKDKPDVPGEWLGRYSYGFSIITFNREDVSQVHGWKGTAYALLEPDPPPEPKPENLRSGEFRLVQECLPCHYVAFPDKNGRVPVLCEGEWRTSASKYVRPASTGKD